MSDVQRVAYAGVDEYNRKVYVPDPNGTHALMPWAKWERVRSFECCKDAERAPRLEAKVLEQRAEIETSKSLLYRLTRLGKELEETKRYWKECQIEHHKRNQECQRLRKMLEES